MPHLAIRDEDNNTRKKRQAQLARGPGWFVYDGSHFDTEHIPTPLLSGGKEVQLGEDGLPVVDAAGRAVYKPAGVPVIDIHGKVVMGGTPKVVRHAKSVTRLRGYEFKEGEKVYVADRALALKLRGMPGFEEVEGEAPPADDSPKSRPVLERAAELAGKLSPGRKRSKGRKEDSSEGGEE